MHNKFAQYQFPKEMGEAIAMGINPFGTVKRAKMFLFADSVSLSNADIDGYMGRGAAREEGEDFESYKNRLKFTKLLLKHRAYLYQFSKPKLSTAL